jgi:hypothetical protein
MRVEAGTNAAYQVDTVTVEAWVSPFSVTTASGSSNRMIISKGEFGYALYQGGNSISPQYRFYIYDSNYRQVETAYNPTALGVDHVVGTYDRANVRMYVNGVANGTPVAATGAINDHSAALWLNANPEAGGQQYGVNRLILVRVWNRALAPAEIAALYADPYAMFERPTRQWVAIQTAGGTTYTETGSATSPGAATGADVAVLSDAGSATSVTSATGADAPVLSDTGSATSVASASGPGVIISAETASAVSVGTASGADAIVLSEAGSASSAGTTTGADSFTASDVASSTSSFSASAADALINTETGAATSAATFTGADALTLDEIGSVTSAWSTTGIDTPTFADSGAAASAWTAGGADALTVEETATVTLGTSTSGAESINNTGTTYIESGAIAAAGTASGADSIVLVESGSAAAASAGKRY